MPYSRVAATEVAHHTLCRRYAAVRLVRVSVRGLAPTAKLCRPYGTGKPGGTRCYVHAIALGDDAIGRPGNQGVHGTCAVVEITRELGLEVASVGSMTMHAEELQSGAEADESYYIRNEEIVREREEYDPAIDPPPDLAVEVDLSSSSSRRLPVYAELGIPEVWRYDGANLTFQTLGADGNYHTVDRSLSFPLLRSADLERFVNRRGTAGENALAHEFRDWLHQSLGSTGQ